MSAPAQSNKSHDDKAKATSKEYPIVVAEISEFDPKPVDSVVAVEKSERERRRDITIWANEMEEDDVEEDDEETIIWANEVSRKAVLKKVEKDDVEEDDEETITWVNVELCEIVSELCVYRHLLRGRDRERFEELCDEAKALCYNE